MNWIDRQKQEPDPNCRDYPDRQDMILVWSDVHGVVSCRFDYGDWLDVIDLTNIEFRYWMSVPPPPEEI